MSAVRYPPSNMNRFQEHSGLIFSNSLGIYKSAVQHDGNFGALCFLFFFWCQSHVEYIVRLKRTKNSVFVQSHVFASEHIPEAPLLICSCPHFLSSSFNRKEERWLRVTDRKRTSKPTRRRRMISRRSRMNTDADGPSPLFRPYF